MAIEIKGYIPNTMLDWEGMLASTIFLPGCNFRCPYCQNADLVLHPERLETVPFDLVKEHLLSQEGWIEGVCITGGEPCINRDLPAFCERIKELNVGVKVDTNGSLPDMLEILLEKGLVDFVAMDIKAPLEPGPYRTASGNSDPRLVDKIRASIAILKNSNIQYEFRTTVVPMMHGPNEISKIARALEGEKNYYLQHFNPKMTLDPRFAQLKPFTEEDMEMMLAEARKFVPGASKRGAGLGLSE